MKPLWLLALEWWARQVSNLRPLGCEPWKAVSSVSRAVLRCRNSVRSGVRCVWHVRLHRSGRVAGEWQSAYPGRLSSRAIRRSRAAPDSGPGRLPCPLRLPLTPSTWRTAAFTRASNTEDHARRRDDALTAGSATGVEGLKNGVVLFARFQHGSILPET